MKKIIPLIIILFFALPVFSQIPSWGWTKTTGGTMDDKGTSIATDKNGNVLVTGNFESDSIKFGNITLARSGVKDIFIVKYSATGNVVWAMNTFGSSFTYASKITTDEKGNVFVTGYFSADSMWFGTEVIHSHHNATDIFPDIFVVKLDPDGNVLWARAEGGLSDDLAYGIAVDVNGNVFITGNYSSTTFTFGASTLTSYSLSFDSFILKYDSSGNPLWAKGAGVSYSNNTANGVTTDQAGNCFITGYFSGGPTITFDTATLTHTGGWDTYIVKYDPAGNVVWAKSIYGDTYSHEGANAISADGNGNIYVTGFCTGYLTHFDTIALTGSNINTEEDVFIAKYNTSGNVVWAKILHGDGSEMGQDIKTDTYGNVSIAGYFGGTTLYMDTDSTTALTNVGSKEIFIANYDSLGNLRWAKSTVGNGEDKGLGIATDENGNIFWTGYFNGAYISFGGTTIYNSHGGSDVVIAKVNSSLVSTGESLQNIAGDISAFPNPFSSTLTISFSTKQKQRTIKIIDLQGKEKECTTVYNTDQLKINRGDLKSGVYILSIEDENKHSIHKKIIVQ